MTRRYWARKWIRRGWVWIGWSKADAAKGINVPKKESRSFSLCRCHHHHHHHHRGTSLWSSLFPSFFPLSLLSPFFKIGVNCLLWPTRQKVKKTTGKEKIEFLSIFDLEYAKEGKTAKKAARCWLLYNCWFRDFPIWDGHKKRKQSKGKEGRNTLVNYGTISAGQPDYELPYYAPFCSFIL